jgi:hypothetical protein
MLAVLLLCHFLWQWTTASLTTVVALEAVAARRQWQQWQWTTIGCKSGRQQEHQWLHDGVQ